jgi:hypothetical protein
MAAKTASATQRGRRLLAVIAATVALLAAASMLLGGAVTGRAADDQSNPGPIASPPCKRNCTSPQPTDPLTSPTPTDCFFFPDACATPTPPVLVVSPVPSDPSPSPSIPAYLKGVGPSPTQNADGSSVISSPVPLGGGFVDQLPTPSQQAAAASAADLAPHQSGVPLPFVAVGVLLILGAVGSLLYAIAPREKPVFSRARPGAGTSPVLFTPYGPDAPGAAGTNLLTGGQPPRPGPKKPA